MKGFLGCATAALLAALSSAASAQSFPELRLKYASHVPGTNVVSEVDKYFADELRKRSAGRVQVDFYWNRAIGKQQEMLPLIGAGAVDFTTLETAQYAEIPMMGFMNALPLVHFDARKLISLSREIYQRAAPVQNELKRIGGRVLWVRHLPHYQLLCRKPYRTVADFKGAKLRSYGAFVPVMWQSIGANAVNVVASELYDGLSKGTFDCAYLPPAFLADYKLFEPAKFLIDVQFGMIEFAPTVVPTVVWEKWPESVRKLVTEVSLDTERFGVDFIEKNHSQAIEQMVKNGVQIVKFEETDKLLKMVPNMLDVWADRQKQSGRGAQADQVVGIARKHLK
jgi:TRAP-type transport system periplasmic protein